MLKHSFKAVGRILTKADVILIILLLSISVIIHFSLKNNNSQKTVNVYVHDRLIKTLTLTEKQQIFEIETGVIMEIRHNKVRLLSSTCRNQICVKQGWTDTFPIVCVPNEIILVIKGKKVEQKMLITS